MSRSREYSRSSQKKVEFVEDVLLNGPVIFGRDARDDWQRHSEMRSEIEEMFRAHYGDNYDDIQKRTDKNINWKHLGQQLKDKCKIVN